MTIGKMTIEECKDIALNCKYNRVRHTHNVNNVSMELYYNDNTRKYIMNVIDYSIGEYIDHYSCKSSTCMAKRMMQIIACCL